MSDLTWLLAGIMGLVGGFTISQMAQTSQRQRLQESFKALSFEALQASNRQFLDLAKSELKREQETSRHELDKRAQAVNEMLKPFEAKLNQLHTETQEMEKARAGAYEGLKQHLVGLVDIQTQLKQETAALKVALRKPEGRGRWGEMQLRRVLEMAGMMAHCDFVEQESVMAEDGRLRPDVIVNLPQARRIVVDCKTPLDALLDAAAVEGEAQRAHYERHAKNLRDHMKKLAQKAYWQQFDNMPDFVIMFVPGEHFLSLALQHDPDLFDDAFVQKIILATPINLIGLLKTIAYAWRQEKLAQDAQRIAHLGRDLYDALATLSKPLQDLGKHLHKSVDVYNRAAAAFEGKALVKARRLSEEHGIDSGKVVELLEPVEMVPRALAGALEDADEEPKNRKDVA
jgi:DNA recombination protein RmuC